MDGDGTDGRRGRDGLHDALGGIEFDPGHRRESTERMWTIDCKTVNDGNGDVNGDESNRTEGPRVMLGRDRSQCSGGSDSTTHGRR